MSGNKKVLLSGASGFIGSHIASRLIQSGYNVIAIKRNQSQLFRCNEFINQIEWINIDNINWDNKIAELKPEIFVHTAWEGINADDRNNWTLQKNNFDFSAKLFDIAINSGVTKVIALGSQAEYGILNERVTEQYLPQPADAYGATKLYSCNYLKLLSQKRAIQWYWLRVFSVYGPWQGNSWILPTVINSLLKKEEINLTLCNQIYDYMYIGDFTRNLLKVVESENIDNSGIYNYCSGKGISLKDLLNRIAAIIEVSGSLLNFGAIPYRSVQSMYMEGDCSKFESVFGNNFITDLDDSLKQTIKFYKLRL